MKPIETERLILRNWQDRDRDVFHIVNSDEQVMQFFPFRRSRAESDAFMDRLAIGNEGSGYGFRALELKSTGQCVGMAGLKSTSDVPLRQPEAIEIGWRLAPDRWRRGYVAEAAEALVAFGFDVLDLPEIISFAVWNNEPSIAVMRKLGMSRVENGDFDHPAVPESQPHLMRYALYALSQEAWRNRAPRLGVSPS